MGGRIVSDEKWFRRKKRLKILTEYSVKIFRRFFQKISDLIFYVSGGHALLSLQSRRERKRATKRERGSKEERESRRFMVYGARWLEKRVAIMYNSTVNYLFLVNLFFEVEIFKLIGVFMMVDLLWMGWRVAAAAPAAAATSSAGSPIIFLKI